MAEINLIPTDAKKGTTQSILSRKITKVLTVSFIIFVVFCVAVGGVLFFRYREISTLEAKNNELKSQVQSLQQNEGSLVLLRDRLTKIQSVLSARDDYDKLGVFETIRAAVPQGGTITETKTDVGLYEMTLFMPSSQALSQVIDLVKNAQGLENVTIGEITFSATTGYSVTFTVL